MSVRFTPPGRFRDAKEFRDRWRELAPSLDCDLDLEDAGGALAQPLDVFGRRLSNRWAAHPMEGWDGTEDGRPSEHTLRRWRRFGISGAALIWGGEAFAVCPEGRANPNQLHLRPGVDAAVSLRTLREQVLEGRREAGHGEQDLAIGLQLTHSGRFARPTASGPAPRVAFRHPVLDSRFGVEDDQAVLTDGELESIGEHYVAVARLARDVGFDFVDVKCCHGYLLHELLGAHTRGGSYGGSFENRVRLFRLIVQGIRSECPGLHVGCRVSIVDVHPYEKGEHGVGSPSGWEASVPYTYGFGVDQEDPRRPSFEEPVRFLQLVRDLQIPCVNLTVGSPYYNPHLQRPAAYPPSDGYQPPEDPLLGVAFQLDATRRCKAAVPELVFVGSGYSYLQEWLPHVAQHEVRSGHVDVVGIGRMVLSYPELPADVLAGRPLQRKRLCRTFSDCTTGPRNGMLSGCFPLDDHYRGMPEASRLRQMKKERDP